MEREGGDASGAEQEMAKRGVALRAMTMKFSRTSFGSLPPRMAALTASNCGCAATASVIVRLLCIPYPPRPSGGLWQGGTACRGVRVGRVVMAVVVVVLLGVSYFLKNSANLQTTDEHLDLITHLNCQ